MKLNYVLGFLAAISLNISAEIWKDYSPSEEIVEMTVVKVKANYVDDYLVNLKSTWVDSLEVQKKLGHIISYNVCCLLYTSPSPRDQRGSRMPSSA